MTKRLEPLQSRLHALAVSAGIAFLLLISAAVVEAAPQPVPQVFFALADDGPNMGRLSLAGAEDPQP